MHIPVWDIRLYAYNAKTPNLFIAQEYIDSEPPGIAGTPKRRRAQDREDNCWRGGNAFQWYRGIY